jgi:hypothetical protein
MKESLQLKSKKPRQGKKETRNSPHNTKYPFAWFQLTFAAYATSAVRLGPDDRGCRPGDRMAVNILMCPKGVKASKEAEMRRRRGDDMVCWFMFMFW